MSDQLDELDKNIEKMYEILENEEKWELDFPNPYNKICPDCFASIPQAFIGRHIGWHKSQYSQLRSIMQVFDRMADIGLNLTRLKTE